MTITEDALTRQIEVTARLEGEIDLLRQKLDLAERVIAVLREESAGFEFVLAERDREITRLHAMIDGACT